VIGIGFDPAALPLGIMSIERTPVIDGEVNETRTHPKLAARNPPVPWKEHGVSLLRSSHLRRRAAAQSGSRRSRSPAPRHEAIFDFLESRRLLSASAAGKAHGTPAFVAVVAGGTAPGNSQAASPSPGYSKDNAAVVASLPPAAGPSGQSTPKGGPTASSPSGPQGGPSSSPISVPVAAQDAPGNGKGQGAPVAAQGAPGNGNSVATQGTPGNGNGNASGPAAQGTPGNGNGNASGPAAQGTPVNGNGNGNGKALGLAAQDETGNGNGKALGVVAQVVAQAIDGLSGSREENPDETPVTPAAIGQVATSSQADDEPGLGIGKSARSGNPTDTSSDAPGQLAGTPGDHGAVQPAVPTANGSSQAARQESSRAESSLTAPVAGQGSVAAVRNAGASASSGGGGGATVASPSGVAKGDEGHPTRSNLAVASSGSTGDSSPESGGKEEGVASPSHSGSDHGSSVLSPVLPTPNQGNVPSSPVSLAAHDHGPGPGHDRENPGADDGHVGGVAGMARAVVEALRSLVDPGEPAPQEADWLAMSLPFDPEKLDQALAAYFDRIDDLGDALADLMGSDRLLPWLGGTTLATAACLIARRRKRGPSSLSSEEEGDEETPSWLLDLVAHES